LRGKNDAKMPVLPDRDGTPATGCQQTTVEETASLFDDPAIFFNEWGMYLQLDPGIPAFIMTRPDGQRRFHRGALFLQRCLVESRPGRFSF
jgi:hypothetical protein